MPHVISVDNKETFEQFVNEGYIGVRLPLKYYKDLKKGTLESRKLTFLLATIYDIFADLKRVKINDEIFVHVKEEQEIFGVFRAVSTFLENPQVPEIFKSSNLFKERIKKEKFPSLSPSDFLWQVSIKPDERFFFNKGFDANDVLRLKDRCQGIWTIPERWKYEDKPKTVRPLLPEERSQMVRLLQKYNPQGPSCVSLTPKKLEPVQQDRTAIGDYS
ncbi:MAG: hypothetical protein QXZ70_07110 [Candidatus Bathyarchaeia archaeon]